MLPVFAKDNEPEIKYKTLRFETEKQLTPRRVIPAIRLMQYLYTIHWLYRWRRCDYLKSYMTSQDPSFEQAAGLRVRTAINPQTEDLESPDKNFIELEIPESAFSAPSLLEIVQEDLGELWHSKMKEK